MKAETCYFHVNLRSVGKKFKFMFIIVSYDSRPTGEDWITLNGGPTGRAGWRAVLPNEKHEFSAGWRAAQKGGPAGCTTGWASGLHIKAVWWAAH